MVRRSPSHCLRKYAHFVDGGITDNLGLLAGFDIVEAAGGPKAFLQGIHRAKTPTRYVMWISVDAATNPEIKMDGTIETPSLLETVAAMSDAQLHRYNIGTRQLMTDKAAERARAISTPETTVTGYAIRVALENVAPEDRQFFNNIPTSFALSDEQVDRLIAIGGELLRKDPEFQRFLSDLRK